MTYITKPKLHHPSLPKNKVGYTRRDYEGKVSTLCAGCGHDSISAALIEAFFDLEVQPHRVAKLSGIGCSSKTPDYFLGNSHGFNTVHGRMPSVLTGANLANKDLIYLGVSGDGDSASIGLGQFAHVMRRGVNMTYILENNGVYGLTKGQFSATADRGSKAKRGAIQMEVAVPDDLPPIQGDEHQLCQVFTNLVINAFEALGGTGRVRISATTGLMEGEHVAEGALAAEAPVHVPTVVIQVADDGPGIPPELTDRVFNAFFTTKAQGSGLGLAIVRKIIDAHDGRIDVTTAPAQGTTFTVTLPVCAEEWFQ